MLGADERFPVVIPRHVRTALRAGETFDDLALVAHNDFLDYNLDSFLWIQRIHDVHALLRTGERGTICLHPLLPIGFHLNLVLFHHGLAAAHSITIWYEAEYQGVL